MEIRETARTSPNTHLRDALLFIAADTVIQAGITGAAVLYTIHGAHEYMPTLGGVISATLLGTALGSLLATRISQHLNPFSHRITE